MMSQIASRPSGSAAPAITRRPRPARARAPVACAPGRGGRGTSPSPPACPSRPRSPRRRAAARPSAPSRAAGRRRAPACTRPDAGAARATPPPPAGSRRSRTPSPAPAADGGAGAGARRGRGRCSTPDCRATSGTGPPLETGQCGCKALRAPPGRRPRRPADPRAGTRPAAARPVHGARPASPALVRPRPWREPRAPDPTGLYTPAGHVPGLGGLDAPPPVWVAGTCGRYPRWMQDGTLRPEAVVPLLRGGFGHPYLWRETCPSTQELARGLPEGGVAACEEQTAGRGRRGRSWISKRGAGVLFSLSLHPRTPPERLAPLTLVVAEAVAEAAGPEATVRWPNDVVAGGQKLAGILAEVR